MEEMKYPVGIPFQEKEGAGRGWWGPPKGTHGPGSVGGSSSRSVSVGEFMIARDESLNPAYKAYVTQYTTEDYREMKVKTYVTETGNAGYAIKPDGDIISVFSKKGSGEGTRAICDAIAHGGTKLDCFEGFLSEQFYPSLGFKESGRLKWDDQYAPSGWNHGRDDSPDIVFMAMGG